MLGKFVLFAKTLNKQKKYLIDFLVIVAIVNFARVPIGFVLVFFYKIQSL